jgi:hypothetical protein
VLAPRARRWRDDDGVAYDETDGRRACNVSAARIQARPKHDFHPTPDFTVEAYELKL